ncbi:MAG: hypothetical protein ABTR07_02215 [Candidatus Competibacter denitrificans]
MTHYRTTQAQRTRHQLNREALKRSHRRGDLIRMFSDVEPDTSTPPTNVAEIAENSETTHHP